MKANSLALRLFVTAVAWVLVVLPVAGWILFIGYRDYAQSKFNEQIWIFLWAVIKVAEEHGASGPVNPADFGDAVSARTQWGWYWQIKPLDGKPAETMR